MTNPYQSPQTGATASSTSDRRLDPGVLLIGLIFLAGLLLSIVGTASNAVRDFLMPRVGWNGLLLSMNALIFIGLWIKNPTRRGLLAASFVTLAIGSINGFILVKNGTVDVVENVFHDRIHSAWLWSVVPYLCASAYMAFAAFRHPHDL